MKTQINVMVALAASLLMVGCAKNGFDVVGSNNDVPTLDCDGCIDIAGAGGSLKQIQAGDMSNLSGFSAKIQAMNVGLNGSWYSCVSEGPNKSAAVNMIVINNDAYQIETLHDDETCSAPTMQLIQHLKFAAYGNGVETNGEAVTSLHSVVQGAKVRLLDINSIGAYENCTTETAAVDQIQEYDLTAVSTGPGSCLLTSSFLGFDRSIYTVFQVKNGVLRLGSGGGIGTSANPLKTLAAAGEKLYFTKQ